MATSCNALCPEDGTHPSVLDESTFALRMRTEGGALSNLLFGQTRGRLLAVLFDRPENTFFVRQLVRQIDGSVGTAHRELRLLVNAGLILQTRHESHILYQANRNHPVFPELRALLAKTMGAFHQIREALRAIENGTEFAFVYGSFARGEENAQSDVDLLVVGEVSFDELLQHITHVEKSLGRPINPTIFARQELRAKVSAGNRFLRALQTGPLVFLIGNEHEFRKIR